ncbi:MAG: DUF2846 domain-containing protein [Sulfuritalea sp.]|nr:DUF2846 domain-containing protein [Sulfuritalea sp.]
MFALRKLFQTVLVVLALGGCATPHISSGPMFDRFAQPEPTVGVVYVIRTPHILGSGIWPNLFADGRQIASPKNGTFTILRFSPGTYRLHTATDPQFWASVSWNSELDIQIDAGKVYFVELFREIQSSRGLEVTGVAALPVVFSERHKELSRELRVLTETQALPRLTGLRFEPPETPMMQKSN